MTFLGRVRAAVKAATQIIFSGLSSWWQWGHYGAYGNGGSLNYGRDIRPDLNSIVVAAVGWMARNFPEAPPRVQARKGVELVDVPDHPLTQLLRRPNPFYSGVLLWIATVSSWLLTGNAYWLKIRSAQGRVVELWWIPSMLIRPAWSPDGKTFITHYEYRPDGSAAPINYRIEDVVHFRYGIDPDNMRLGLSPLACLFREIFTDDEAANFSAAILRNLGVPGVVITPDDESLDIGPEVADDIKRQFSNRFGGERRGEPLVLSGKSKVQVLSFSPEQMTLTSLRRVPEERVTAVLGIPAIVCGLGAGLDHATYSNMEQAREAAFENGIIPTQRLLAEDVRVQLLADFSDITKTEFDFDLSKVRVLQDDQKQLVERLTQSLLAGGMTLGAYRRHIGEPDIPGLDDVLYVPKKSVPMRPDQILAIEPAAAPVSTEATPFGVGTQPTNGVVAPGANGHVPVPAAA